MAEPKLENLLVANFLFIIFTTMVATRTPRHSMARTPRHPMARSQLVERVMASDSFKATEDLFSQISRADSSECRARDGGEDRTPRRTHIFSQCGQCRAPLTLTRTCVWLKISQELWDVLHLCAPQKSSTHSMFHRPLSTCLTHFHHFDPRHLLRHRQHWPRLESGDLPALLRQEDCCLAIWLNQLLSHPYEQAFRNAAPDNLLNSARR